MEIIKKQVENIGKVWGVQKKRETEYRLMKYLLRQEVDDGVLLHNVITGELIFLPPEEKSVEVKI